MIRAYVCCLLGSELPRSISINERISTRTESGLGDYCRGSEVSRSILKSVSAFDVAMLSPLQYFQSRLQIVLDDTHVRRSVAQQIDAHPNVVVHHARVIPIPRSDYATPRVRSPNDFIRSTPHSFAVLHVSDMLVVIANK